MDWFLIIPIGGVVGIVLVLFYLISRVLVKCILGVGEWLKYFI